MYLRCNVPLSLLFLKLVFSFDFHVDVLGIMYDGNLFSQVILKGIFDILDDVILHRLFLPHF